MTSTNYPHRSVDTERNAGYLNLRMVIHAVSMIDAEAVQIEEAACLLESQGKCIEAAQDAIDLIYSTFLTDDYFQTW